MNAYRLTVLTAVAEGENALVQIDRQRAFIDALREVPLPPTPIGLPIPQRHTFELPNYGDVPLPFEVQLSQLHKVKFMSIPWTAIKCFGVGTLVCSQEECAPQKTAPLANL